MLVSAGGVEFDVDAIVFDKDGTLIDVNVTWWGVGRTWIDTIAGDDADCRDALARALGMGNTHLVSGGILATGTMHEIETATRSVVSSAVARRIDAANTAALAKAQAAPILAIGDVAGAMQGLHEAGLLLLVASSDDRSMIDRHLSQLEVRHLVAGVASGDGPYPPKPLPDGLYYLSEVSGIATSRMLMVGDSLTDLGAARRAGAAGIVAVVPEGAAPTISDQADGWIQSIEEISVTPRP